MPIVCVHISLSSHLSCPSDLHVLFFFILMKKQPVGKHWADKHILFCVQKYTFSLGQQTMESFFQRTCSLHDTCLCKLILLETVLWRNVFQRVIMMVCSGRARIESSSTLETNWIFQAISFQASQFPSSDTYEEMAFLDFIPSFLDLSNACLDAESFAFTYLFFTDEDNSTFYLNSTRRQMGRNHIPFFRERRSIGKCQTWLT